MKQMKYTIMIFAAQLPTICSVAHQLSAKPVVAVWGQGAKSLKRRARRKLV